MRITLVIDDDVLNAAKEIAASERKSVGKVISSLVRKALVSKVKTRNGVPLLKVRNSGSRVNSGLVRRLHEEIP